MPLSSSVRTLIAQATTEEEFARFEEEYALVENRLEEQRVDEAVRRDDQQVRTWLCMLAAMFVVSGIALLGFEIYHSEGCTDFLPKKRKEEFNWNITELWQV